MAITDFVIEASGHGEEEVWSGGVEFYETHQLPGFFVGLADLDPPYGLRAVSWRSYLITVHDCDPYGVLWAIVGGRFPANG